MIQNGTILNVVDNSGAKKVCCIKVSNGYRKRYARIGDTITVSIKSVRLRKRLGSKIKKGDVVRGLVVKTKCPTSFGFNEYLNFTQNSVILTTKQNKLLGTRVFGAISKSLNYTKYLRIISLCSGIIH